MPVERPTALDIANDHGNLYKPCDAARFVFSAMPGPEVVVIESAPAYAAIDE